MKVEHNTAEIAGGLLPRQRSTAKQRAAEEDELLQERDSELRQVFRPAYCVKERKVARNEGSPRGRHREAPTKQVLAGVGPAAAKGADRVGAGRPLPRGG